MEAWGGNGLTGDTLSLPTYFFSSELRRTRHTDSGLFCPDICYVSIPWTTASIVPSRARLNGVLAAQWRHSVAGGTIVMCDKKKDMPMPHA